MLDKYPPASRRLLICGMIAAGVYLAGCLFYWNGPEAYATRTPRELFAWFTVVTLLATFWYGYKAVRDSDEDVTRIVLLFAFVFCVFAIWTYPYHSTDIFGYVNRGWQQVNYGQNPYVHSIADIPERVSDPMVREHWTYNPSPYGPLFTLIARLVCLLGGGKWWLTVVLFKLVNVAAYALTAWLIWSAARKLGVERPILPTFIFLWNPLILVHHIANGHNDLLLGLCVAAAFYLALTERPFWILPILASAVMIKYAPVILGPFALVYVWRKMGFVRTALSALIGTIIAAATAIPFLLDWKELKLQDISDNATLIDNSLHSFLIHIFENLARLVTVLQPFHDAVDTAIKTTLRLAVAGLLVALFIRFWRRGDTECFVKTCAVALFALIFVASSKLNGWYVGMLLGPVLLIDPRWWLRRLMVLLSGSQLLSITFFKQAYIVNYFVMMLLPQWYIWREWRHSREPPS